MVPGDGQNTLSPGTLVTRNRIEHLILSTDRMAS